jgi:hypothetical protein
LLIGRESASPSERQEIPLAIWSDFRWCTDAPTLQKQSMPSADASPTPASAAIALEQLQDLLIARINGFTRQLAERFAMQVQRGPFAGMRLPTKASWGGGYLAPKLLGSYEQELHRAIEKAVARRPDVVINVGCAEGYYAIGLARRLPRAHVYAFDISEDAQRACRIAAEENQVSDRVEVRGLCDAEQLAALCPEGVRALIVLDCEGAELALLDATAARQLGRADLIVELHDFVDRRITPTLMERFAVTHKPSLVREGTCAPMEHPALQPLGSFDRALLSCEFRPETMQWMVAWSR